MTDSGFSSAVGVLAFIIGFASRAGIEAAWWHQVNGAAGAGFICAIAMVIVLMLIVERKNQ